MKSRRGVDHVQRNLSADCHCCVRTLLCCTTRFNNCPDPIFCNFKIPPTGFNNVVSALYKTDAESYNDRIWFNIVFLKWQGFWLCPTEEKLCQKNTVILRRAVVSFLKWHSFCTESTWKTRKMLANFFISMLYYWHLQSIVYRLLN